MTSATLINSECENSKDSTNGAYPYDLIGDSQSSSPKYSPCCHIVTSVNIESTQSTHRNHIENTHTDNKSDAGFSDINQLDGNDSLLDSESEYATDDEIEDESSPAVLVPSVNQVNGAPVILEVDKTGNVSAPRDVPLMVTNPRSIYNKLTKLKTLVKSILPDLCLLSEHWGRKGHLQEALADIPQYKALEYSRGRVGYKGRKDCPLKYNATGGGAAIIYNTNSFNLEQLFVSNPEGIESVYAILTPKQKGSHEIEKILIGSVYIAPRSQFKQEAIEHIIETMHFAQSQCREHLRYLIAGDVNRTYISDILDSNGLLKQICSVPTRNSSVLENIITDMATLYHPPTTRPPLENDKPGKGKPSDHNILIVAPKAETFVKQKRKKRSIRTMPMPESSIQEFMRDIGQHSWTEVFEETNSNVKTVNFHLTLSDKLKKHFKVKHVKMSSLDKQWFTPAIKQQRNEMRNELYKHGESESWRKMRKKYRKDKRAAVRNHYQQFTDGMRFREP